jgi:hypothetical protein
MKLINCVKEAVIIPQNIRHYRFDYSKMEQITTLEEINDPPIIHIDIEFALEIMNFKGEIEIGSETGNDYLDKYPWIVKIIGEMPKAGSFIITEQFLDKNRLILWADF